MGPLLVSLAHEVLTSARSEKGEDADETSSPEEERASDVVDDMVEQDESEKVDVRVEGRREDMANDDARDELAGVSHPSPCGVTLRRGLGGRCWTLYGEARISSRGVLARLSIKGKG